MDFTGIKIISMECVRPELDLYQFDGIGMPLLSGYNTTQIKFDSSAKGRKLVSVEECYGLWEWIGLINCRMKDILQSSIYVDEDTIPEISTFRKHSNDDSEALLFLSSFKRPSSIDYDDSISNHGTSFRYSGFTTPGIAIQALNAARKAVDSCLTDFSVVYMWGCPDVPITTLSGSSKKTLHTFGSGGERDLAIVMLPENRYILYKTEAI